MRTCPDCDRRFANIHQWHSCIELSLESNLAEASRIAVQLYRLVEAAVAACGEFRVHPQKTRIGFISTMTFASVHFAERLIDVSFITPTPIDDRRIRSLVCYGPTTFAHRIRLTEAGDIDDTVRAWLCEAKRRGDQETLDPSARVEPLVGRTLDLIEVPLQSTAVERGDALVLRVPVYVARLFDAHPLVRVRLLGSSWRAEVETSGGEAWVRTMAGSNSSGSVPETPST